MGSALDQIVNINISQQTSAVAQESFSIPLIVGPTVPSTGAPVNAYSDPSGMLTNGYTTSSPEYIYALELFEQALTPTQFLVGERTSAVAQVDTIAVNSLAGVPGHQYKFSINATVISYTSVSGDTQGVILTALNSALTSASIGSAGVVSGSGSTSLLTITASVPGAGNSYSAIDSELTHVSVTANNGIQNDLAAIIAVNDTWYGLAGCAFTDGDILQAAALIESLKKIYIPVSSTSAIATTASTDVASVMKSRSYKRSGLIYSPEATEGKEAAWLGGQLPAVPGSNNWAFKTLTGCTADVLSAAVQAILIGDPVAGVQGKNVNIYQTVGGVPITQMGTMASGQFIDLTVGIDWLESQLQVNLYSALVNSSKIPYTDKGTGILISAVNAAIQQGVVNGLIDGDSPITITAPLVASVPANQRAQRISPTISFSCRLAGAFNAVVVNGTVTV